MEVAETPAFKDEVAVADSSVKEEKTFVAKRRVCSKPVLITASLAVTMLVGILLLFSLIPLSPRSKPQAGGVVEPTGKVDLTENEGEVVDASESVASSSIPASNSEEQEKEEKQEEETESVPLISLRKKAQDVSSFVTSLVSVEEEMSVEGDESSHNRPAHRAYSLDTNSWTLAVPNDTTDDESTAVAVAKADPGTRRDLQRVGDFSPNWLDEAISAGATAVCAAAALALSGPTGGSSLAWGSYICTSVGFWTLIIFKSIDFGSPHNDDAWLQVHTGDIDTADGNALAVSYHRYNGDVDRDSLGGIGRNELKEWREDLDASVLKYLELRIDDWDDVCVEEIGVTVGKEPSGTGRVETIQISAPVISYITGGKAVMHGRSCVFFGDTASGAVGNFMFHWPSALNCYKLFAGYESMDFAMCMTWAMHRYDILKRDGGYTRTTYNSGREPRLPSYFVNPYGQLRLRNGGGCADLHNRRAARGQPINLRSCRSGEIAQDWDTDTEGRMHSKRDPSWCLEAGREGHLYAKVFLYRCHNGAHQKWTFFTDGRIRNKAYNRYLGVAYCGQNSSQRQLELRNWEGGACGEAQKWNAP